MSTRREGGHCATHQRNHQDGCLDCSFARADALQQRLTAADEREDALGSLVPEAELALKALNVAVSVYDVELADSARRGLRLIIAALKPAEGARDEPNCLLCLDKKTVPSNLAEDYVMDCPDCCGEEG